MTGISTSLLVPTGKILLMGTFGFSLISPMRGLGSVYQAFEKLIIGLCGILFYQTASGSFELFSEALTKYIANIHAQEDMRAFILDALAKAAKEKSGTGESTSFNIPAVIEQAWRTGVWGVLSTATDFMFLLVSNVLTFCKDVLTTLLLMLFPLAAGLYPVFPRIMGNLCLYRLELALWLPILGLVESTSVLVAKKYLTLSGSLGLHVTAIEIISIFLILSIPALTHRFLSGAFSGDFDSQESVVSSFKRAFNIGSAMAKAKVSE